MVELYITPQDIKDYDTANPELKLELTESKGITDGLMETVISSVHIWVNTELNADKETVDGISKFVNYQSTDPNGKSYCTAEQLANIETIVLWETVGRLVSFKQESYSTPKIVQYDPRSPVWADDLFDETRQYKKFHNDALHLLSNLIEEDKEIGSFGYANPHQANWGFLKVNDENERPGPAGAWYSWDAETIAKWFL